MNPKSGALSRWWPTTQSLDLVEGSVEAVATAVEQEVQRFLGSEPLAHSWERFADLDAAFAAVSEFANVPTMYFVLPSFSRWSVLWNNSFLCDGYDSLCHCLTTNHGLTTVHWSAHDQWTTSQSGATFHFRRRRGAELIERFVQVAQEDRRWHFYADGDALPEEDVKAYAARRKRDRLNEGLLAQLLARLGAQPWSEDFYALGVQQTFVLRRVNPPASVLRRRPSEVVGAG